jgi:hypothetical protein
MYDCVICADSIHPLRFRLGFKTCLTCGEVVARTVKHTIVPMAKSNYQPVTDLKILKQLNKYSHD